LYILRYKKYIYKLIEVFLKTNFNKKLIKMPRKLLLAEPFIEKKDSLIMLKKVLDSNYINEGNLTRLFEKKIEKLLNVKYVATCTSGTASIYLALKALGIKNNDEILMPNLTFPATANAIKMAGAKPVLVDINKDNLLMQTSDLLKKINKKSRAIIPVHISGRGSNIKEILKIAKSKKLFLIEDSAEAFMSKLDKKYYGTYGDIGCFSLAPNKIITTGQGGLIVTNNLKLYKKIKYLKDQGRVKNKNGENDYNSVGYNFKFTNLQAAVGLSQLKSLKWRIKKLKENYNYYRNNITSNKEFSLFNFEIKRGELPLWTDVYCSNRSAINKFLIKKNIFCRYFWKPINLLKPYSTSFVNLNNSKEIFGKLMWLPSSLSMNKKDLKKISKNINDFIGD